MIKLETLQELQTIVQFQDFVDVITMQAILHTTKTKPKDFTPKGKGGFTERCYVSFENLLYHDRELAVKAMNILLACTDYEQRQELQGIGGCIAYSLTECIEMGLK